MARTYTAKGFARLLARGAHYTHTPDGALDVMAELAETFEEMAFSAYMEAEETEKRIAETDSEWFDDLSEILYELVESERKSIRDAKEAKKQKERIEAISSCRL